VTIIIVIRSKKSTEKRTYWEKTFMEGLSIVVFIKTLFRGIYKYFEQLFPEQVDHTDEKKWRQ
jgi:hypothetical protein